VSLGRVGLCKVITITLRGKPVAELVPVGRTTAAAYAQAVWSECKISGE